MVKENLPLELLNKHLPELGLSNPLYIESEKELFAEAGSPRQSAVVFLPKSKALINMTLALVSGMVAKDGKIVLVGSNDAGIRSAKELYENNVGPVDEKIVGKHSALYVGKNQKLGANKKIEDYISHAPLSYNDLKIKVANVPGVFSAGKLDEGTKLLLDHVPYDKKAVLDIGCGAGIIGAIYKTKNPESDITMTDVSRLAILATQKTIEINGFKAAVIESDVFSKINGTFDLIISNPPFHTGVETDYSFIESFARDAKKHLNPHGEIYIVANSFLPYERMLEKQIGPTIAVADNKKFKVLKSRVL